MKAKKRIVVIGGGLSGLYLSYLLKKEDVECVVLEASSRLGGRIETLQGKRGTPLEMGATWFSDMHENLISLLNELGIEKYPQFSKGISLFQTKSFEPPQKFFVPESESPSYRIHGGTSVVTSALAEKLEEGQIKLNTQVVGIEDCNNELKIETAAGADYFADKVIVCLPPQLASSKISFSPGLPSHTKELLNTVHTWMAGSIKFTLEFDRPFWREEGFSGMMYSHSGIVTEMYDQTNFEQDRFGFTGFLNPGTASFTQQVRKELVIQQLAELFGKEMETPVSYFDKVWKNEFVQEGSPIIQRPHQNNGHPLLQEAYMDGKLFFCGTESSHIYGGYMEGALIAAQNVFGKIG